MKSMLCDLVSVIFMRTRKLYGGGVGLRKLVGSSDFESFKRKFAEIRFPCALVLTSSLRGCSH